MRKRWVCIIACVSACHTSGRVARVYVAPAALPAPSATTIPLLPEKPRRWPDEQTVVSRDGTFSLRYPAMTFKATAPGNSIVLTSEVSEPQWGYGGEGNIVYRITLTKLDDANLVNAVSAFIDPDTRKKTFSDGTEASFKPTEDFVERHEGDNGARGYVVELGVEGTGDYVYALKTRDGAPWRFECHYCCGMIEKPVMTRERQLELCAEILARFERDR